MSMYICAKKVREQFDYTRHTGEFVRINKKARNGNTGYKHMSNGGKEYIRAGFENSYYYVHRLIWVHVTGQQPKEIDHIDGNSLNNKWDNLREVPHRVNGKNQRIHSTNTSGKGGITYRKDTNKWRARIMVDGKSINLGSFKNKEEAINARLNAENKHGFITGEHNYEVD